MPEDTVLFPPFRLDVPNACLRQKSKRLALMPKDFAVLHYLVTHAGQLVTHEELLRAVWSDTVVSVGVLKVCLRRIRRVLRDNAITPRFITTVHRRGYRFLPTVATAPPVVSSQSPSSQPTPNPQSPIPNPQSLTPSFVGRDTEFAQLQQWLEKALNGERQLIFVTGEPGMGKTTLVDAFVERVTGVDRTLQILREELETSLGLCGQTSVRGLKPSLIRQVDFS